LYKAIFWETAMVTNRTGSWEAIREWLSSEIERKSWATAREDATLILSIFGVVLTEIMDSHSDLKLQSKTLLNISNPLR